MTVTQTYNFKTRYQNVESSAVTLTPDFDIIGVQAKLNITNCSGRVIKSLTNGNGLTVTDTTITINKYNVDIECGVHTYDLELTYPDGAIRRYMKGTYKVERNA